MYYHDLEVTSLNPSHVKLGIRSTSVLSCTWTKNKSWRCPLSNTDFAMSSNFNRAWIQHNFFCYVSKILFFHHVRLRSTWMPYISNLILKSLSNFSITQNAAEAYTVIGRESSHGIQTLKIYNSYSASHDNWCTGTLWNRIITAQCEGMVEVGSARYEPALLPPCPTIRVLSYSN